MDTGKVLDVVAKIIMGTTAIAIGLWFILWAAMFFDWISQGGALHKIAVTLCLSFVAVSFISASYKLGELILGDD